LILQQKIDLILKSNLELQNQIVKINEKRPRKSGNFQGNYSSGNYSTSWMVAFEKEENKDNSRTPKLMASNHRASSNIGDKVKLEVSILEMEKQIQLMKEALEVIKKTEK